MGYFNYLKYKWGNLYKRINAPKYPIKEWKKQLAVEVKGSREAGFGIMQSWSSSEHTMTLGTQIDEGE
jgi:hypothetical protein